MSDFIEAIRTVAEMAMDRARQEENVELYSQAHRAMKLANALDAINQTAFKSKYSQVDINLHCYGSQDGDVVDYEIEGYDEWGAKFYIASDITKDSIPDAIIDMSQDEGVLAVIKEAQQ